MATANFKEQPYLNLKGKIVSKGLTQKDLAKKLDIDSSTFSMKVNRYNGRDFTFSEAIQLSKILDMRMEEF